jgi:hypothetical protein
LPKPRLCTVTLLLERERVCFWEVVTGSWYHLAARDDVSRSGGNDREEGGMNAGTKGRDDSFIMVGLIWPAEVGGAAHAGRSGHK